MFAETKACTDLTHVFAGDEQSTHAGEITLTPVREAAEERFGYKETYDSVADELQLLVVLTCRPSCRPARGPFFRLFLGLIRRSGSSPTHSPILRLACRTLEGKRGVSKSEFEERRIVKAVADTVFERVSRPTGGDLALFCLRWRFACVTRHRGSPVFGDSSCAEAKVCEGAASRARHQVTLLSLCLVR